jgi:hypothetical protein
LAEPAAKQRHSLAGRIGSYRECRNIKWTNKRAARACAIHRFDNNGGQDAKALCVITPAAIGPQYFRESAEVINAAAGGPPDRAKMAQIIIRHVLTPAPRGSRTNLVNESPKRFMTILSF